MGAGATTDDSSSSADVQRGMAFLKDLFGQLAPRDFAVRFPDGITWEAADGRPRFTFVLRHPGAVRNMFWPPGPMSFTNAFIAQDYDVEGDITAYCEFCTRLETLSESMSLARKLKLAWRLLRLPRGRSGHAGEPPARLRGRPHSRERDRQAIAFHYDRSNEFFRLFLDEHMVYTCALFKTPDDGLEQAQEQRFEQICRRLRLKPGERLLDVGCGWGGLVRHAARHHGARAVGVTISRRQAEYARERIRADGLDHACRVELLDYRDIPEDEPFDKITTIEVAEHFGGAQFPTYFQKCMRLLRPQGSLVMQQITLGRAAALRPGTYAYNQAYIFPDGEMLPAGFTQQAAEGAGFETRVVESFREHYGLTLRHWLKRFQDNRDAIVRETNEATYRVFLIYLAACLFERVPAFGVHQMLFVKPDGPSSGCPLSWENG